jgi:succinate dehydrogenase / fumarate reductase membrane anchor subunit
MGNGTQIGRVRGLGSAKEGAHHWLKHRITAGSNLLLMTWFMISIARLVLLVISVFSHFRIGLQTVIEDYQSNESRVALLLLLNLFTVGAAATAIFSILKIAFTGTPA